MNRSTAALSNDMLKPKINGLPGGYALPVVRAASMRTGRGARLKRIEDVDRMAKSFRNAVETERNHIVSAAKSRGSYKAEY